MVPAQAESAPSSVSNMKLAGIFVPGTRNPVVGLVVGFQTMPVGAAGVGNGGLVCVDAGLHAVLGTVLSGRGIATCSATLTPAPSYRVEQPEALSAIQNGLAAGVNATPHAFRRTGSVFGATPGKSAVKFVTLWRLSR